MCNHFDTEHIGCCGVNQRKGKTGKDEPPQIRINQLTNLGMIEQKIRRTSNLGFETLAQTRNL